MSTGAAAAMVPSAWTRAAADGLASGGAWALLSLLVTLGLGIVRTVIVARLLGAHEFGTMAIALLVLGTLEALTATGVETSLASHPGRADADLDPAFTLQAIRGAVLAVATLAVARLAGRFFANPAAVPVVQALALVPLLRGVANPGLALLIRRGEFRRLFWWGLPEALVAFGVAVGLALLRGDVWALVAGAVAAQLVATAMSYAVLPRRPRLMLRGRGMKRLLHYGKWISGTRILMFVSLHADNALVGRFLGTSALGLYQVAFRVGETAVETVTRAASVVALPTLSRLRRSPVELRRRYLQILGFVLAVNTAFALLMLMLGGPLVAWLLGPEWAPAGPVLQILAVAMVFRGVMLVSGQLFYAIGRPRFTLEISAVRVLVMLPALYPLLQWGGMAGVAAAVLLAHLAAALAALSRASRSLISRPALPS